MGRSREDRAAEGKLAATDSVASEPRAGSGPLRRGIASRRRLLIAVLLGPVVLLLAAFGLDRAAARGAVLRGVEVGGVALGGLEPAQAAAELRTRAAQLRTKPLEVRVAGRAFELDPEQIDFAVDVERSVDAALAAGRQGSVFGQLSWWIGRWLRPEFVPLRAEVDAELLAQEVATWEQEAITDPPFEGAVARRDGQLEPDYPRAGRGIDREALRPLLLDALRELPRRSLTVPLARVEPRRGRAEVDEALVRAKKLVDGPVVLTAPKPPAPGDREDPAGDGERSAGRRDRPAEGDRDDEAADQGADEVELRLDEELLTTALRSRVDGGDDLAFELYFDADVIDGALTAIRKKVELPPRNAAFVVGKRDRIEIVPSSPGRLLDAERIADAVLKAAESPERRGALPIRDGEPPELTTEQARQLGIKELVGKFTTHHPCCRPRVDNIHRIADWIDGTLVRPGETFSINELVGRRTRKKGFFMAPGIEDGEMVDSVGGGISQFATTLFNAVLYAGYDVVERAPHSWYFSRYPMGFDATLSYPKPDLVFRNDSDAGVLIKTEYSATTITVKLFGDTGGRKVETKKSHPTDVTQPPIKYVADSSLEPDESKTKYKGRVGWSVYVSRTITFPDGSEKKQRRKITYKPRPKELRVHPCKIPKGEEGYTGRPCPEPEEPEDEDDGEQDEQEPPAKDSPEPEPAPEPEPGDAPAPTAEPSEPPSSAEDLIPPSLIEGQD